MSTFDENLAKYRTEQMAALRNSFPEIKKLDSLDDLQDLKLLREYELGSGILLDYSATGPSLFPYVSKSLIDKGVAKKHNIIHTSKKNIDKGIYKVALSFYGNRLQIFLYVHKNPLE